MEVITYPPSRNLPWHHCEGKHYENYTFCPVHREETGMSKYTYDDPYRYIREERDQYKRVLQEMQAKYEPVTPTSKIRIGDREREATAKHLAAAHVHGYLPVEEFTARMGQAMAAQYAGDLPPLTADLPSLQRIEPPEPKPEPAPVTVRKRRFRVRVQFGRAA